MAVSTLPTGALAARRGFGVASLTGWLGLAGVASIGAGAIHAAAIGVHSEHRPAVWAFTIVAALQLGWGALALVRSGRLLSMIGGLLGVGALAGWVVAKTSGIGFVDGLDEAESIQWADGIAAGLAAATVLLAARALFAGRSDDGVPALRGPMTFAAVAVTVVAVFAMGSAGTHVHAHGAAAGDHHGGEEAAHGGDHHAGHGTAAHPQQAVAPEPYDATLPVDLGGVDGVTPSQQYKAEMIVETTLRELPQWADYRVAEAAGFHSIGDGATGTEHFINQANIDDDGATVLDPNEPESLVYDTTSGERVLVAAMYMLERGLPLEDVPDYGGPLMQFHTHENLCYNEAGVLAGLTDGNGNCRPGTFKPEPTPMVHVWIEPHPCGPFAALEGIGGGTIEEGEEVLCDHAHGATA